MKKAIKVALAGAAITGALFTAPTAEAASAYTVQKGDTLSKIAKAHNTTIQQLKQWNQLSGDRIYIAQHLVVASTPSKHKVTAISVVEEKEQKPSSYIVVKGDNLTKIAKKYNITVASLMEWNNLKSDAIKIGQKLAIHLVEVIDEAPTATAVEAVITFKETADAAIEKQLNNEKTAAATVSKASASIYTQAIEIAQEAIGIPYKYGGNTLEGFDCSGFVSYVYNNAGIKLERKSSLQYFEQDTVKVEKPVPGDIVFFKNTFIPTISHMGIYIGNDQFIHAGSKGITISNVNEKYWAERFVAYKRLADVK
jgi:peptidoglycan DL-endopeptidase LytE